MSTRGSAMLLAAVAQDQQATKLKPGPLGPQDKTKPEAIPRAEPAQPQKRVRWAEPCQQEAGCPPGPRRTQSGLPPPSRLLGRPREVKESTSHLKESAPDVKNITLQHSQPHVSTHAQAEQAGVKRKRVSKRAIVVSDKENQRPFAKQEDASSRCVKSDEFTPRKKTRHTNKKSTKASAETTNNAPSARDSATTFEKTMDQGKEPTCQERGKEPTGQEQGKQNTSQEQAKKPWPLVLKDHLQMISTTLQCQKRVSPVVYYNCERDDLLSVQHSSLEITATQLLRLVTLDSKLFKAHPETKRLPDGRVLQWFRLTTADVPVPIEQTSEMANQAISNFCKGLRQRHPLLTYKDICRDEYMPVPAKLEFPTPPPSSHETACRALRRAEQDRLKREAAQPRVISEPESRNIEMLLASGLDRGLVERLAVTPAICS